MGADENLKKIKTQIIEAVARAGAGGVGQDEQSEIADKRLMAVSKTRNGEEILPILEAGHRLFGENRVQEAAQKWPQLRQLYPDVELHLIGPLQSNKTSEAVALFDGIQTVDRPKIAKLIAEEMRDQGRQLKLFVQVNVGDEPQKAGVAVSELGEFLRFCREEAEIKIVGLMCIPPVDEEAAPYFILLKQLAEKNGVKELSMGMSSDFETAVELGADIVRVGSALFGPRS